MSWSTVGLLYHGPLEVSHVMVSRRSLVSWPAQVLMYRTSFSLLHQGLFEASRSAVPSMSR